MLRNQALEDSVFVRCEKDDIVEVIPDSKSLFKDCFDSGIGFALTEDGYIQLLIDCMRNNNMSSYNDVIRAVGGYYGLPLYLWKSGPDGGKKFMRIPFSVNESIWGIFSDYEKVERFVLTMMYLTYSTIGSVAMVSDRHINSLLWAGKPALYAISIGKKKLRILKDLHPDKRFLVETVLGE